jgi:hypothetical protein
VPASSVEPRCDRSVAKPPQRPQRGAGREVSTPKHRDIEYNRDEEFGQPSPTDALPPSRRGGSLAEPVVGPGVSPRAGRWQSHEPMRQAQRRAGARGGDGIRISSPLNHLLGGPCIRGKAVVQAPRPTSGLVPPCLASCRGTGPNGSPRGRSRSWARRSCAGACRKRVSLGGVPLVTTTRTAFRRANESAHETTIRAAVASKTPTDGLRRAVPRGGRCQARRAAVSPRQHSRRTVRRCEVTSRR